MTQLSHILEIQTGKHKGRKVRLTQSEALVGRSESAKIRIASEDVSREHCVLVAQAEGVLVRDLGSRNGTFIDGKPVSGEKLLLPGGTLTVGPLTMQLLGAPVADKPRRSDVRVGGKSSVDQSLSDDDIASWLSDDQPQDPATSDTAINLKTSSPPKAAQPPVPEAVPRRKEFKSIAEEAQDIIRRHFEALAKEHFQDEA